MRVLKRALAIVYLAATIVALGTLVCQFWGPYTYRFMLLMRDPMLGTPGTTARVRFLPSKTTVQTVEVSGE